MFYYLKGTLAMKREDLAVVDINGAGYRIVINPRTYESLPGIGEEIRLYTHLYLREEIAELYGFASESEQKTFKMLLTVSGVGPKAALAILSVMPPPSLAMCVVTNDAKAFTVAPGIGLKTAQRLILELKDKVKKEQREESFIKLAQSAAPAVGLSKFEEAADALSMLGYSNAEIAYALKDRDFKNTSLEDLIKEALRSLVR